MKKKAFPTKKWKRPTILQIDKLKKSRSMKAVTNPTNGLAATTSAIVFLKINHDYFLILFGKSAGNFWYPQISKVFFEKILFGNFRKKQVSPNLIWQTALDYFFSVENFLKKLPLLPHPLNRRVVVIQKESAKHLLNSYKNQTTSTKVTPSPPASGGG